MANFSCIVKEGVSPCCRDDCVLLVIVDRKYNHRECQAGKNPSFGSSCEYIDG